MNACRPARSRGFTLVEVLVALGIVAVALLAGAQATSALMRNAERQRDVLLAQLCAQNTLARLRLSAQMPAVGDSTIACTQAGLQLPVHISTRPTPNPSFRRVDVQVFSGDYPVLRFSAVLGRN